MLHKNYTWKTLFSNTNSMVKFSYHIAHVLLIKLMAKVEP
jgi:hypothetical protein